MDSLRTRRIEAEWELLRALAEANPDSFATISRAQDEFHIVLRQSPAWVGAYKEPQVNTEQALRFVYPRLFPALPLEAYLARPILHVNVDPLTGFICLWQAYRPGKTIIDAILITRSIMANRTVNHEPMHRMQTGALALSTESRVLPMPDLVIPERCRISSFLPRPGRQRLSVEFTASTASE